jgi:hypothetical protein
VSPSARRRWIMPMELEWDRGSRSFAHETTGHSRPRPEPMFTGSPSFSRCKQNASSIGPNGVA